MSLDYPCTKCSESLASVPGLSRMCHLEKQKTLKGHCLPTNHQNGGVKSLNSTTVQSFVHVSIQIIELQEHACPILMYGPKLFLWFSKKGDIYILLCLFSAYHQTLSSDQVSGIDLFWLVNSTRRRRR